MRDRQDIIEMVRHSADRYGSSNPQQLKYLTNSVGKLSEREIFFGLFSFFYDPDLQGFYDRQQLAGTLLYKIRPSCPLALDGAIYAMPAHWDLSIEEVPWYFCSVFSKDIMQKFLEELIPDVEDGGVKKSFETLLFWVKAFDPEGT